MVLHFQLLLSTILYFSVFVCGLMITICLAIIKSNVSGKCFLFSEKPKVVVENEDCGKVPICDFELYLPAITLLYAFAMTGYHGYAALVAFRDQHIGRTMWIMPWLLLNSLVTLTTFVAACVFSIGFHSTCLKLTDNDPTKPCSKIFNMAYKSKKITSFDDYNGVMLVQFTYWASVLLWIGIFIASCIRLMRNIRARSSGTCDPSSDVRPIAELTPTA
ncbi:transmembrane protein 179B-like [Centruroides sculpturatus]|uniref:transmembrane protein 179B-like n=1 Tax=Centruroides sculpturatus TaxID=218467 RepID=UPI000C6CDB2D|nr:transmembrane protein 179B-like [Centruroides sculpturatus]